MAKKKKKVVETIYQTTMYIVARPTRKEIAEDIKWIRLKHLRKNLVRAADRGTHDVSISLDDLYKIGESQGWKCALTGAPMEFTRGGSWVNNTNPNSCTIDRKNPYGSYSTWNVQLTAWKPNFIKNRLSDDELIEFCKSVIDHRCKEQ